MSASLLIVFAVAKAIALMGHDVPRSWWSPIALFWQDAAVVLVFAVLERIPRRGRGGSRTAPTHDRSLTVWLLYAVLAFYVAVNVPVTRVLSTPMTWPMWRAARGPLSDSIAVYATWDNVALTMTVVALAIRLPLLFTRLHVQHLAPVAALIIVALGPLAARHVDTRGLERNAWTAVVTTAMPRVLARPAGNRWTVIGLEQTPVAPLPPLHGAAAGRHVIMVSLESTAAQYLGLYGASPDVMPNLSALAEQAIVFDHAYAVYPESIKGLFSILCSSYPAFDTPAESYDAAPCASIAALLGRRGYRTALFHSGRFGYLGMESIVRRRGYDVLEDAGDIGGRHDSSFGVDEPSTVARILSWIDRVPRGDRFFVTYLPIAGHHPYETPLNDSPAGAAPEESEQDRYRRALRYSDAALGALRRGVHVRGLDETTLWIVFGDHGEAFGQHDGNYGHTFQIFDENVRVPLLIAAPGLVSRQVRARQVVSLMDVAPTIAALLGQEGQEEIYQGRSLLDGAPRMAFFFADYSRRLAGLRDGRFKTIVDLDSGRAALYDLEQDPGEQRDISRDRPDRAAWYERNLRAWSGRSSYLRQSPATISIDDTFSRRVSDLISFDPLVPTGLSAGFVDGTTIPVTRTR